MNIQLVKRQINAATGANILSLEMVRQFDAANVKQPWLSHWDNDTRVRVTMHEELFTKLKAEPTLETLALKHEVVAAHLPEGETDPTKTVASYHKYIVIEPKNVEGRF